MKERHNISPEQFLQIVNYIENEGPKPDDEILTKLNNISFCVTQKLLDEVKSSQRELNNIKTRIQNKKEKEQKKQQEMIKDETAFSDTGIDSIVVADALLYCLQQVKTYKMSKTKFIYTLYEAYASWLASKKERLFIEHPVATEYGPQFWRVYNKLNIIYQKKYTDFEKLAKINPGIAVFIKNVAFKYYDMDTSTIKRYITKSEAYKNAMPEFNNGKWNKEIKDSDIFLWKANLKR